MSRPRFLGYLLIAAAACVWGLAATGAKFLFNRQYDVFVVVQTRALISCLVLWILLTLFKRKAIRRPKGPDIYKFALLGVIGIAFSTWPYYKAIKLINVATAIILQYTAPVLVMLYEVARKRDSFSRYNISSLILSLVGCFLAVGGLNAFTGGMNAEGLMWGSLAAFGYAFFNVYAKQLLGSYTAWTGLVYALSFTSLFWFCFNPPWSLLQGGISAGDWGVLFIFAMCSILIPYALYYQGLNHIRASHAIIVATLEPIVAAVSAAFVVNEFLTGWQYVGALCVIAAILLLTRHREQTMIPME